jgi:3-hydroxyisobutyrate dehydrogenase
MTVVLSVENTTIGLIGLGNLGRAIGLNLLSRGWRVKAHDVSAERLRFLVEKGAGDTDAAGLADCDVLLFVVPDETAIWPMLRGNETGAEGGGLLSRLGSGHTVIVHSTVLPSAARELAAAVSATGARFVDAPVSGGAERAELGKLTIFAGADPDDLEAARPVLEAIGEEIFALGPVGAGAATKLANQLVLFSSLSAVYEALRLTRASGVDESAVLEAIGTGTGDTWAGRNWGFFDRTASDYNRANVPVENRPWSKDLREIVAAGRDAGLELPLAELVSATVAGELERHAKEHEEMEEVSGQ